MRGAVAVKAVYLYTRATGLIAVLMLSFLIVARVYPSYARVIGFIGASTSLDSSGEVFEPVLVSYTATYMLGLGEAMAVAAPIASSLFIAFALERGEERYLLTYYFSSRLSLYAAKIAALYTWLLLPSIILFYTIPVSLSPQYGAAMVKAGLSTRLPLVVGESLAFASVSALAATATGRLGYSLLAGLVACYALLLAWEHILPYTLSIAAGATILGLIAYLWRDV